MEEVAGQGRTVLFVSHNMAAVSRFCNQCVWLDQGTVREVGEPESIVARYLSMGLDEKGEALFPDDRSAPGSEFVRLLAVRILDSKGAITTTPDARQSLFLEVEYRVLLNAPGLRVGARLLGSDGSVLLSTTDHDGSADGIPRRAGRYTSRCEIPGHFLNYGQYFVSVGADFPMIQSHFAVDRVLALRIERVGGASSHIPDGREGLLRMTLPWAVRAVDEPVETRHVSTLVH
jgi:lipopolysaccharide transport system ATP-binding protein